MLKGEHFLVSSTGNVYVSEETGNVGSSPLGNGRKALTRGVTERYPSGAAGSSCYFCLVTGAVRSTAQTHAVRRFIYSCKTITLAISWGFFARLSELLKWMFVKYK